MRGPSAPNRCDGRPRASSSAETRVEQSKGALVIQHYNTSTLSDHVARGDSPGCTTARLTHLKHQHQYTDLYIERDSTSLTFGTLYSQNIH